MAKSTIKQFTNALKNFADDVTKEVTSDWNKSTLLGANASRALAPIDTGRMVRSLRTIKAVTTPNGIKSSYIFNVDYAAIVNIIHKTKSRFAEKGINMADDELISDVKKALGKVWRRT